MGNDYTNGFLERKAGGRYEGRIVVEGISLGGIVGVYFKQDGDTYLWLKRKRILEYDEALQFYYEREAKPQWEAYLKKQIDGNSVAYKGEFAFMHFKFSIVGVWDKILGKDKQRLNLFVERLPMAKQTIINSINEHNRKCHERGTVNNDD